MGICKLCGKDARLVKAHIIPESMYPFEGLPRQPLNVIPSDPSAPIRKSRVGEYDSSLLCKYCEAKFSPWDDYALRIFRRTPCKKDWLCLDGQNGAYVIGKYDYKKLKLFFISLLWRASETEREAFSQVNVGKKYRERLEDMLRRADPGDAETFATFLVRFSHPKGIHKSIMSPQKQRYNGIFYYRFYLCGFMCCIKVDKRLSQRPERSFILTPGEPLRIIVKDFQNTQEYRKMVSTIKRIH